MCMVNYGNNRRRSEWRSTKSRDEAFTVVKLVDSCTAHGCGCYLSADTRIVVVYLCEINNTPRGLIQTMHVGVHEGVAQPFSPE